MTQGRQDFHKSFGRRLALGVAAGATALAVTASSGCSGPTRPAARLPTRGGDLVLTHVVIVDTHDGRLSPDMTVSIVGGRISRIDKAGRSVAPPNARIVDARGKYLVPGFVDGHAHVLGYA